MQAPLVSQQAPAAMPREGGGRQGAESVGIVDRRAVAVAQRNTINRIQQSPRMVAQRKSQQVILGEPEPFRSGDGLAPAEPAPATQLSGNADAKPNNTGLPDKLKAGVESLSGFSLDHVKVHFNSAQPAQLNAHAFAQGSDIHVGPGQEQHLPHEAWHVVQQAQGRVSPTRQMKSGVAVNDDGGLEMEADAMGAKAMQAGESEAVQLASQSRNQGCYCPGCCTPAQTTGNTYSLKAIMPSFNGVAQLATTISIRDASGKTASGQSGNKSEVSTKLARWPTIKTLFESHVQSVDMAKIDDNGDETGDTYPRSWNMCAEPHALANLLDTHAKLNDHTVNKAWLGGLQFPAKAVDKHNASLWPCPVCEQWVTKGGLPMALRAAVQPDDPIENEAQVKEEKDKGVFEGKMTRLGEGAAVSFDSSGSTRDDLKMYLQYFDSLKANQDKNKKIDQGPVKPIHAKAWEGIIHKNSAPEFVEEASNHLLNMQANLKTSKEDRTDNPRRKREDTDALKAMTDYYEACAKKLETEDDDETLKTPNQDLLANLLSRLADEDIDGEIRNLNRKVAMQEIPEEFKDCKPAKISAFIDDDDGSLTLTNKDTDESWTSD